MVVFQIFIYDVKGESVVQYIPGIIATYISYDVYFRSGNLAIADVECAGSHIVNKDVFACPSEQRLMLF